jgi:hypothetical protein
MIDSACRATDSAQLVESDMNISFIRLLWKYGGVATVAGEMVAVACWNGIHRLQDTGATGQRRMSATGSLFRVPNTVRHCRRACG